MNIEKKFINNLSEEEFAKFLGFGFTLTPDVDSGGMSYTSCCQYARFRDSYIVPLKNKANPSNRYLEKLIAAGYLAIDLVEYVEMLLENKEQKSKSKI